MTWTLLGLIELRTMPVKLFTRPRRLTSVLVPFKPLPTRCLLLHATSRNHLHNYGNASAAFWFQMNFRDEWSESALLRLLRGNDPATSS